MNTFENGAWSEGQPNNGDWVKVIGASVREFRWFDEVNAKTNKVVVTSHNKRAVTSIGVELSITSEFRDSDDNLISDFNDSFVMPIKRVEGSVEKSILMTFINGVCTRAVTFNQSGEYEVTKDMVNLHLDNELDFDGFNISVYE